MTLPWRCRFTAQVGNVQRQLGCGAVRINGEWCFALPTAAAEDGYTCPRCLALLTEAQERARIRIEQRCNRRAARGYGPGTGDAFEGF